jgi:exonuclease VII small subunit
MQHHVNEGKEELNFSEFGAYTTKRQNHKMEEVAEQIEKGEMPLDSYLWIHTDAKLTAQEKETLLAWAKDLRNKIAEKGPL